MFDLHLSAACAKPSAEEQILFSCKGVVAKAACGRKSKRSQTSASSLKTSYPTHTGKIWEDLGSIEFHHVPPKPRLVILVLAECYLCNSLRYYFTKGFQGSVWTMSCGEPSLPLVQFRQRLSYILHIRTFNIL